MKIVPFVRLARVATTFTSTLLAMKKNVDNPINEENGNTNIFTPVPSFSSNSNNVFKNQGMMLPSFTSLSSLENSFKESNIAREVDTDHFNDVLSSHSTFGAQDILKQLPKPSIYCKRIYLIRNGETDWNTMGKLQGGGYDIELNQNGIIQANMAGDVLQQIQLTVQQQQQHDAGPIQLVVSSHLERSEQTANIIYRKLIQANHQSTNTNNNLIKRVILDKFGEMRFGQYEGLNKIPNKNKNNSGLDRYNLHNQMMLSDPMLCWPGPGGESIHDVIVRVKIGLQQLYDKYPNISTICIVAHGRLNRILLQHLVQPSSSSTNIYDKIEQGNACINVLDYNSITNEYAAHIINYMDHHNEWQ